MTSTVRNKIVQVTNVSPSATTEQLRTLFGHIGVLEEFVLYPGDEKEEPASKVAYIRYHDPINAEVALHLNNTVFLDRALIVLPLVDGLETIPDEKYANLVRAPPNTAAGVLPRTADWPLDVISMVVGRPGEQVIHTIEPRLSTLVFPLYPPLPATTDGNRIEEIRRTILVTNLDPKTTGDQVLEFFNKHAEVRCVRMAGTEFDRAAYVEFTQQPSIIKAFGLMGATLNGRQIMVQHSNCAIIKPASNFPYFDEASKAAAAADAKTDHRRGRSRSRSRERRSRSRRRSSSRRRRSRSRDRRSSRSRHSRRRSRTRSRSHGRRRHSRSVSRDRRRGNRGRSKSRERRKYHRSRSRSSRRRSSRSRSRGRRADRRDRDRDRGSVRDGRDRTRDRDRRDRDYDRDRRREKDRDYHRDSKSRKHRDESPKVSTTLSESLREERRERDSVSAVGEGRNSSPVRPTSESGQSTTKHPRRDSSESSSRSENGSEMDRSPDKNSPACQNGVENDDSLSQSFLSDRSTKPVVVGVKLAGPEDMDHVSPQNTNLEAKNSPVSNESDSSGDAMDMEA
ncbi:putative splicing factor, arginine/serine-rich 7 [Clonorchis sinensis]|nr:putative splicing factor, arginine/serine-rich 7 [Clonorchis sinensis]